MAVARANSVKTIIQDFGEDTTKVERPISAANNVDQAVDTTDIVARATPTVKSIIGTFGDDTSQVEELIAAANDVNADVTATEITDRANSVNQLSTPSGMILPMVRNSLPPLKMLLLKIRVQMKSLKEARRSS